MRAERAVEPTKSENITVTWRRSAESLGAFGVESQRRRRVAAPASSADCAQNLTAITKDNADLFEVLIGQVAKDREINAIFSKTIRVLGQAELFEPVGDLLHGAKPTRPSLR